MTEPTDRDRRAARRLRRHPRRARPRPARRRRRGRRPARAERRRQDDDAADDLRAAPPDQRHGHRARRGRHRRPRRTRIARRGLAHVPEDRSLFFDLTVNENLRLGLTTDRAKRKAAYDRAMEMFPALAPLRSRLAGLLSGGEQQMLAMARALVVRAEVPARRRDEPRAWRRSSSSACCRSCGGSPTRPDAGVLHRRAARAHGARGRRPRLRPQPRRAGAAGPAAELLERRDLLEASYLGDVALD